MISESSPHRAEVRKLKSTMSFLAFDLSISKLSQSVLLTGKSLAEEGWDS
jgi:hypothetical protein